MPNKPVGVSYKQVSIDECWDAIVIGSGIGGLTAAALLAKHAGKRVLVLERHYTAGGFTHAFHRPGYEWDVGVHYIGQVQDPASPLRAAFDHLSEGRLAWNPMADVYDQIRIADRVYEFPSGVGRFRESLLQAFPSEGAAIDGCLAAVLACVKTTNTYFAEKAIPRIAARLAGAWMRAPFLRWANSTTAEVLAGITTNRELTGLLTAQWGDYGLPPAESSFAVHATIAAHYFDGASYPVGGATQIAASIAPVIERAGGKVVVSAEVDKIMLDRSGRASGVRMADGREFLAPIVVSDAGALNTFGKLLPPDTPGCAGIASDIRAVGHSMSYLSLYAGLNRSAADLGFTGTNIWAYPTPDHDANLARYVTDPAAPFPLLFISFPSAKDPDFEVRHPGHATVEVITLAPYRWFSEWESTRWKHRGSRYDEIKQSFTARLREQMEKHVPATRGHIEHVEISTPLTTRHFANYQAGEAYGLNATPARFRLRCLCAQTPVRNLFLAGQDVATLGVTGALFGGAIAASAILRRNLVGAITRPVATRAA
ncbi:MAG TPA: NAD(P)/FAD-dependent oxidoreductase [Bryobacteraceae bacterium]|jgi:all-trans-retinol 13,14-reductase|nr:NAD(P)/FAD-dependent oxidoreductase [Bryobacteraceae bacterium]